MSSGSVGVQLFAFWKLPFCVFIAAVPILIVFQYYLFSQAHFHTEMLMTFSDVIDPYPFVFPFSQTFLSLPTQFTI